MTNVSRIKRKGLWICSACGSRGRRWSDPRLIKRHVIDKHGGREGAKAVKVGGMKREGNG